VRSAFLVAAFGFGWWWLRDRWSDVSEALAGIDTWQITTSFFLAVIGLLGLRQAWGSVLASLGHRIPWKSGSAVFFVGQLGKYVPGSVWHLTAQGEMARRHSVPIRATVTAGLMLIYWLSASAALVSAFTHVMGWIDIPVPTWLVMSGAILALCAMTPWAAEAVSKRLAGSSNSVDVHLVDAVRVAALMLVVWMAFGSGVSVLSPTGYPLAGNVWWGCAIGGFSFAFVAGLLSPLVPAGAGVREVVLVSFLSPTLGAERAAALALMVRAVHLAADFTLAGLAWVAHRRVQSRSSICRNSDGDNASVGI
jgi:uncharacterized membrane protein YbhN (UPF0104 family)